MMHTAVYYKDKQGKLVVVYIPPTEGSAETIEEGKKAAKRKGYKLSDLKLQGWE